MPWPIDIRCAQRFQSTRAQGQSLSTTAFGYPVDIPPPAYAAQASFPFPVRLEPLGGLRFWWRRSQASLEAFSKKIKKSLEASPSRGSKQQMAAASSRSICRAAWRSCASSPSECNASWLPAGARASRLSAWPSCRPRMPMKCQ